MHVFPDLWLYKLMKKFRNVILRYVRICLSYMYIHLKWLALVREVHFFSLFYDYNICIKILLIVLLLADLFSQQFLKGWAECFQIAMR